MNTTKEQKTMSNNEVKYVSDVDRVRKETHSSIGRDWV